MIGYVAWSPIFGRWGNVPILAEKFDGAVIWNVVVTNGATFENGKMFFSKEG